MSPTAASPSRAARALSAERAGTAGHAGPAARELPARPGRRVVDAPIRLFHWLFAASFALAYLTGDGERWRMLHVTLGYTMVGLLAFRLIYGFAGPRHARLGATWRKAAGMPAWLRTMRTGGWTSAAPWRQAQHIATAVAVVALLAATVPLTASGYATWQEWTGEWLAEVHEFLAEAMLTVVFVHVGTIALVSLIRRRNQALPMVTGRIDGTGPDLVKADRRWLAVLMLVAVLVFGAWSMTSTPAADATPAAQRAGHARADH